MACSFTVILALFTLCLFQVMLAQDASTIGSFCVQDSDCLGAGFVCKRPNTLCSYGECGCPTGYAFDYIGLQCRPSAALNMPCDSSNACQQLNSVCVNGPLGYRCQCADGYVSKRSADNIMNICVSKLATLEYGAACFDSAYCKPPFICSTVSQKCDCDVGYSYTGINKRRCAPKSVQDSCNSDDECLIANAWCTGGKCQCAGGYKTINWRMQFREPLTGVYTAWPVTACIGSVEPVYTTDNQCLTALRRSISTACDSSSICIPCNPNVNNTGYCVALNETSGTFLSHSTQIRSSTTNLNRSFSEIMAHLLSFLFVVVVAAKVN